MPFHLIKKNIFSFDKTVWKVLLDEYSSKIILELRDKDFLKASFASIDLLKNQLLWEKDIFENNWWWSLSQSKANAFVLQKYNNNSRNPENQGVFLGNLDDAQGIWQDAKASFETLNPPFLNILDENKSLKQIDLSAFFQKNSQKTEKKLFPFHYYKENAYFGILEKLIFNLKKHKALEMFEYLEYEDFLLMSYFVANSNEEQKLKQYFLVIDVQTGKVLIDEILNANLEGITIDSFFVWNYYLIFVTNQKQISIYKLEKQI